MSEPARTIRVRESATIPALDYVFAFGPMVPFVVGAAAAWLLPAASRALAADATVLWAAAILLLLAGVRRGLSFRTESGPTVAQLTMMLVLFGLGLGGLGALAVDRSLVAAVILFIGFGLILAADPLAAKRGEAPLYFGRLRALQMPIALTSLAALGIRLWLS